MMYSNTDDIRNDYRVLLTPFVEALNAYNDFIGSLTDKERFKSFFTSDSSYNAVKTLHKNIRDFQPKAEALKSYVNASISKVDNPTYAEYFLGSLDKWSDIMNVVNLTFENLTSNIQAADKEYRENKLEGLLRMVDRDYDECRAGLEQWSRSLTSYIAAIGYIHRYEELDITDYNLD